jgi:hypothetical protein
LWGRAVSGSDDDTKKSGDQIDLANNRAEKVSMHEFEVGGKGSRNVLGDISEWGSNENAPRFF